MGLPRNQNCAFTEKLRAKIKRQQLPLADSGAGRLNRTESETNYVLTERSKVAAELVTACINWCWLREQFCDSNFNCLSAREVTPRVRAEQLRALRGKGQPEEASRTVKAVKQGCAQEIWFLISYRQAAPKQKLLSPSEGWEKKNKYEFSPPAELMSIKHSPPPAAIKGIIVTN